jgi:hypothetical protein
MAQTSFLLSTLVTGALAVGVAGLLVRGVDWRGRRYVPESDGRTVVSRLLDEPAAWTAGFFSLLVVFGGGALVAVGAISLPADVVAVAGVLLAMAAVAVVSVYTFYGTYAAARGRGRASSMAAAQGATVIGLLFLGVLVLKLVLVD